MKIVVTKVRRISFSVCGPLTLCNKEFSWPLERSRLPSEDILIESVARKDDDDDAAGAAAVDDDGDAVLGQLPLLLCRVPLLWSASSAVRRPRHSATFFPIFSSAAGSGLLPFCSGVDG